MLSDLVFLKQRRSSEYWRKILTGSGYQTEAFNLSGSADLSTIYCSLRPTTVGQYEKQLWMKTNFASSVFETFVEDHLYGTTSVLPSPLACSLDGNISYYSFKYPDPPQYPAQPELVKYTKSTGASTSVAFPSTVIQAIACSGDGQRVAYSVQGVNDTVYLSANGGSTWVAKTSNSSPGLPGVPLFIEMSSSGQYIYVQDSAGSGYRSTDYGASWSFGIPTVAPTSSACTYSGQQVYVSESGSGITTKSTSFGTSPYSAYPGYPVGVSGDGSVEWYGNTKGPFNGFEIAYPIPGNPIIRDILVSQNGSRVAMATSNGVWVHDDNA